ncbi:MAG: SWIM zinc finger family protein [Pseudomonadota bacterium]
MALSQETVASLAPDQASLRAANTLMKPAKWPVRQVAEAAGLVWGECQGSGANPYRVVFDANDHGYTCTCPSRKFPCKHVLALMWMFADGADAFAPGETPDWVADWMGRRRKPAGGAAKAQASAAGKSLSAAKIPEAQKAKDPKAEARALAAAKKRAEETEAALLGAMDDLETWIADQLSTGLSGLLADLTPRCRAIAARMVDGKATALAGRLDEIPDDVARLPSAERVDGLISHLGKLVLLARAFRANPKDPGLYRTVASAEARETVVADANALRVHARWEVVGERTRTRRDGLVSQATWLLNCDGGAPAFALLLDFFPASAGRRGSAFAVGEQFRGEVVYYPSCAPLRAVIAERAAVADPVPWPAPPDDPLASAAQLETLAPWETVTPVLLPEGRVVMSAKTRAWWRASDGQLTLPLADVPPDAVLGMVLERSTALWDGMRLSILSSTSRWGKVVEGA